MPLFAIVPLSSKLHFVLDHERIAAEYFYTIFCEQKMASEPISTSKLVTNTNLVQYLHTYAQDR